MTGCAEGKEDGVAWERCYKREGGGGVEWEEEEGSTGLHGDEAGPGIIRAAVAEAGDKTACYDWDICVFEGDFVAEVAGDSLQSSLARLRDAGTGRAVLCCWQSGLRLSLDGSSLYHDDRKC